MLIGYVPASKGFGVTVADLEIQISQGDGGCHFNTVYLSIEDADTLISVLRKAIAKMTDDSPSKKES